MKVIAFDLETALIRPGRQAPDMVCMTWQELGKPAGILHHTDAEPFLTKWLRDSNTRLVGHNVAYDLAVVGVKFPHLLPDIFAAYAQDRVTDTMLRSKLIDIAGGVYREHQYSLEATAAHYAGLQMKKDGFRLFYWFFRDVLLSAWVIHARQVQLWARAYQAGGTFPDFDEARAIIADEKDWAAALAGLIAADPVEVISYAVDDARATLASWSAQERHAPYLADQYRQAYAAWALHLSSAWGVRTDGEAVEALRAKTEAYFQELEEELKLIGFVKPNGVRDTKRVRAHMLRVCEENKIEVKRTPKGGVKLDKQSCEATEDLNLIAYAELSTSKKVLTTDIKLLRRGTVYPVHPRYDLAESGRTTSSPNIQNQSKKPGLRECIVPRPGMLFAECDYPYLEIYTDAQCNVTWFGSSTLADALNAGFEPHLAGAARLQGITYEEALANRKRPDVAKARQLFKAANFGFPGGMGARRFVESTRKQMTPEEFQALGLDEQRAKELKQKWLETWPEMVKHFARVSAMLDPETDRCTVESLYTQRFRGRATYCAACNNGFQALGSDCAKRAACLIAKAQYVDTKSPLYGTRTVAFVHDEFILEVPDDERAHDAAVELARLMVVGANEYLPDVPIPFGKMEPLLMRRWSKNATATFDANGRLVPWAH